MSQNKKLEFEEIEYLAFEGGGAMGGAYLGALCAMQDLDMKGDNRIFPGLSKEIPENLMNDTQLGQNDGIKGVAGSSIGAIVGLLVSMGYTSEQINARLITDRVLSLITLEKL